MAITETIEIELTMRIGEAALPIGRLLRMPRGGVIPLGRDERKPIDILANGQRVAGGRVVLNGENVAVVVTGDTDR
ncbi:MAG: FliM/FliN family flagellar motor switch protein [Pseudomonadota bacterium]